MPEPSPMPPWRSCWAGTGRPIHCPAPQSNSSGSGTLTGAEVAAIWVSTLHLRFAQTGGQLLFHLIRGLYSALPLLSPSTWPSANGLHLLIASLPAVVFTPL